MANELLAQIPNQKQKQIRIPELRASTRARLSLHPCRKLFPLPLLEEVDDGPSQMPNVVLDAVCMCERLDETLGPLHLRRH